MSTEAGSPRARRTATRLLRWYPKPWRVRYQQEMQALIDDMPVGWGQVANLAGAAAREWLSPRALGWPSRSAAGRVSFVRALKFAILAYTLDGIARIFAAKLLAAGVVMTRDMLDNYAIFMFIPLCRVLLAYTLRLKRIQRSSLGPFIDRHSWLKYTSDWEIVAWTVTYLPSLVLKHALPIPSYLTGTMRTISPYMDFAQVWIWTNLLIQASRRSARLRKIYFASFRRRPADNTFYGSPLSQ